MSQNIMVMNNEVCDELKKRTGRKFCFLVGRGTTAIFIALKSLMGKGNKVIIPASSCLSPANVSIFAGLTPIFCDVDLQTFNIDPQKLRETLKRHPDARAIIPIHLYGRPCEIQEIIKIGNEFGVPVIEDAAQALGAKVDGKSVGAFGEFSVLSFGHTKIIDIGWGGALLTDDPELAKKAETEIAKLPSRPGNMDALFEDYRKDYYALTKSAELAPEKLAGYRSLIGKYSQMFLFNANNIDLAELLSHLQKLDIEVSERKLRGGRFRKLLAGAKVEFPVEHPGEAPWRFSLLLPAGVQKTVTEAIRAQLKHASNWYPLLPKFYDESVLKDTSAMRNAKEIEARVLNLWVDQSVDEGYIQQASDIIKKILS